MYVVACTYIVESKQLSDVATPSAGSANIPTPSSPEFCTFIRRRNDQTVKGIVLNQFVAFIIGLKCHSCE